MLAVLAHAGSGVQPLIVEKGSARLRSEVAVVEAQWLNPHNMRATEFDKIYKVIR